MPEKPLFANDYTKENVELVRQTCLYVSTKLGDLLDDLVVVGGLRANQGRTKLNVRLSIVQEKYMAIF